jgi:NAD(P)H-hydrate epimerase
VGLATVATPAPLQLTVAAGLPEMMTEALHATENDTISVRNLDYGSFFQLTKGKDTIALGPGLSTHPETQQFVRAVVAETSLPLILDADGLNAYAGKGNELREHRTTHLAITPHPGEMARLLGCTTREIQAQRLAVARRYAAEWNVYVVLKGQATILASPDGRAYVNTTGNPGMATGGTGDVLTGMLAGVTAQFGVQDWARILGLGVYLHGLAGDFAASEQGEASMIAGDILSMLPRAFRSLTSQLHHA